MWRFDGVSNASISVQMLYECALVFAVVSQPEALLLLDECNGLQVCQCKSDSEQPYLPFKSLAKESWRRKRSKICP
jgi:hypothetical protein